MGCHIVGLVPTPYRRTKVKYLTTNIDAFVKSRKMPFSLIPAKAGIHYFQAFLDSGFRRSDEV